MGRTRAVCEYVAAAGTAPLDGEVEVLAGLHLLDTLAAIVASRDLDAAVVARRYVERHAGDVGGGGALVLGTDVRAPVADAVFAGAMTAHAAEINDFMPEVFVQPGPAVVAAAIGVGSLAGSTGPQLIRAVATGYDLAFRVPLAVGVGNLRRAGIATHGVGPCFGAAVAAAVLLGLPPERVADVLSLTAQQASGSWQWLLDVAHIEKAFVFAGLGARNGTQAALLVDAGYHGVAEVLDQPGTWFTSPAFARGDGDGDAAAFTGLGSARALRAAAFKRYPVGGPAQPAVAALLDLTAQVAVEEVDHVMIQMPGRFEAFRDAGMPALNLRYLTAVILLDGVLDFEVAQSLDRRWQDHRVLELMERVEVRHDPSQEAPPGAARTESARVTIRLRDGSRLERYVPHVAGYPSHPMAAADVEAKAMELVAPRLGRDRAVALVQACRPPFAVDAEGLAGLVRPGR